MKKASRQKISRPNPFNLVIRLYIFGLHFLAYYWLGQQALPSHWLEKVANSTPPFLSLANPALSGISKMPGASQSTFLLGNYTPHVIINGCKNRRIHAR